MHGAPIARLGGVAIALAFWAPICGLYFVDSGVGFHLEQSVRSTAGVLGGGALLLCLGIADDTLGVRARNKLVVQTIAACLAYALGIRIEAVSVPVLGYELEMGVFALPITVLWIVGITNAVNLIDGLDGLAAGVAFFAALTNLVVAVVSGSVFVAVFMASLMGAMAGFLLYNFNPARIFMGDSGSYLIGYVLATTSLVGASQKASTAVALLVPMVAMGVPIFDTLFSPG
jgi:UDP-GlcNAc:undecaprenyl-phosphate GlcNAc-1-phosphate transferase